MSRRVPLIGAAVAILLLGGWFVGVWRPAGNHLHALQAARTTALTKQTQLESQLVGLERMKRAIPGEETKLRRSLPALPIALSADTVIDQIDAIVVADKIGWTNESEAASGSAPTAVTPTTVSSAGSSPTSTTSTTVAPVAASGDAAALGVSTLSLTLVVRGSYANMQHFIADLQVRPRLIVIDSLSYSPGAGAVSVTMTGRAFYDSTPLPTVTGKG